MYIRLENKIEYYLYGYKSIKYKIENLENDIDIPNFKQNYISYVKSEGSSVENQVIEKEQKINELKKWRKIIKEVLKLCKKTDILMYQYIVLKYFKHLDKDKIRKKLNIEFDKQEDIRNEILQYIFFHAQKENLIKEEGFE